MLFSRCRKSGNLEKFLEYKKTKNDCLTFKDKRRGWEKPLCVAKAGDKEISLRGYSWLYFSDSIMRPVCYKCQYETVNRVGDFGTSREKHHKCIIQEKSCLLW